MKKYQQISLLFLLSAALLTVGCSSELVSADTEEDIGNGRPVVVEAFAPSAGPTTRSLDFTGDNFNEFYLYGFNRTTKKITARGKKVHFTKTDAWTSDKGVLWPAAGVMDYYAIAPTIDESFVTNLSMLPGTLDAPGVKSLHHKLVTNSNEQRDLLYSVVLDKTEDSDEGKIILSFSHALVPNVFTCKSLLDAKYEVVIHGLNFYRLKDEGTMTFEGQSISWALDDSYGDFTFVFDTDFEGLNTTAFQFILPSEQIFLTMPHKSKAYATSEDAPVSISDAHAANKSYLGVLCKIKDTTAGQYLTSDYVDKDADGWIEVFFPFGGKNWRSGTFYTTKIQFNGGYDKEGKLFMNRATLEGGGTVDSVPTDNLESLVTTEEWTDDGTASKELEF